MVYNKFLYILESIAQIVVLSLEGFGSITLFLLVVLMDEIEGFIYNTIGINILERYTRWKIPIVLMK